MAELERDISPSIAAPELEALRNEVARLRSITAGADQARAAFLVEATDLLSSSLDMAVMLRRVAELAVPRIADWCVVERIHRDGSVEALAVLHRDPAKADLGQEIRRRFPAPADAWHATRAVARSGKSMLLTEIDDQSLARSAQGADHLALLRELGIASAMIVPMLGRDAVHGVIRFVNERQSPRFGADDLAMAEQLAQRAALAMDNAELYQAEHAARTAAERATERLGRIQLVTAELAVALTSERVAEVVIDHGASAIGAVTGGLWLLDGEAEQLQLLRSTGFPDAAIARYGSIPLERTAPLADSVRSRIPVFLESRAQYAERYAESESRTRDLTMERVQAIACLPLLVGTDVLGGLSFVFEGERLFEEEERRFLMVLADHCALALQRAELYEAERAARAETELLYTLVDATGRAPTLAEVYEAALSAMCSALGTERVAILFSDDAGTMRFKASRGLSQRHIEAVDGHAVWPADAIAPEPILVSDTEADTKYDAWRELLQAERIRAMAFVPLIDRGRLIGKLMAYFAEPRPFSGEELRVLRTVASHVAEAAGRKRAEAEIVRLLDQAEAARVVAEQAAVSREHLLAVVAHDLRNLLHAAEMRTSLLLRRVPSVAAATELLDDLQTVQRSTAGMSRLIGDLLDAAAIEAGRLSIQLRPCPVAPLFDDAMETARVLCEEREMELLAEAHVGELEIVCDRERVLQVLANLIGNAVKFSARHASIQLEIRAQADEIQWVVRDRGSGIAADQLEHVFDRYFKGEGARPGVGLGLYISRGLVEAQGGRIWVESTPGVGTNVFVALPIAAGDVSV